MRRCNYASPVHVRLEMRTAADVVDDCERRSRVARKYFYSSATFRRDRGEIRVRDTESAVFDSTHSEERSRRKKKEKNGIEEQTNRVNCRKEYKR